MFCPKCGKEFPDAAKFCPNCGQPTSHKDQYEISSPNEIAQNDVKAESDNKIISNSNPKNTPKLIIAIIGIVSAVVIALVLFLRSPSFTPQKVTEKGTFELTCEDSIEFSSIDSILKFSNASVDNIDYDTMTLDLTWVLQLTPEMDLKLQSAPNKNQMSRYEHWISSANIEGSQAVPAIVTEADSSNNSIIYYITATVNYDEDPSALICSINDNLSIVLKNTFQFSPEKIMLEKAKIYINNGQYDTATDLLQEIGTEEAKTAIEGINFIDYAEIFSTTSAWQLSDCLYLSMLGFTLDFDYDPVTYTFTMMLQIPSYWETLAGYGLGEENPLGDNVPYDEAKALYDKFSSDGYPGVTCRVLLQNSAKDILDEGSYSKVSSSLPNKTDEKPTVTQPGTEFPPTLAPIDPNDPNADIYSDYLGLYVNAEGFALSIEVGTSNGLNYYACIYENLDDARNFADPILEFTGGTLDFGSGAMSIWFNDIQGEILFFRDNDMDKENLTFEMTGDQYYGGVNTSPYSQSTYYMVERFIDPMA